MRKIHALIPVFFVGLACGSRFTDIARHVLDLEEVLPAAEERALDSLFLAHETRTGNEIALITHPTFHGRPARDFAVAYADSVGVGKEGSDNGVVIAFSKARRAVFIATGKGAARVLHDSACQRIVDEKMLPRFKEERYVEGLQAGSQAVVDFLEQPGNAVR